MENGKGWLWLIILGIPAIAFLVTCSALPPGSGAIMAARYYMFVLTCSNIVIMLGEMGCLFASFFFFSRVLTDEAGGGSMFLGSVLWIISMFLPVILGFTGGIKSCWQ